MTQTTSAARPSWRAEIGGGLNAGAALLPFVLSWGWIVYGSAGPAAARIGLTASVLSVVLGALVMLAFSRAQLPAAAPSASTALILGTLVVNLLRDPALAPGDPAGAARLVSCTAATVVGGGTLLIVFGLLRAGSLVRYVPQPVLAGFMNGVALLILWSQVPALLGVPPALWSQDKAAALAQWQPVALAVAVATTALAVIIAWRRPRWPAALIALLVASASVLAATSLMPGLALPLERVGTLAAELPRPDALAPWIGAEAAALLARHGPAMALTAALLALIGGLESVLAIAAVDPLLERRSDPDRELIAIGLSNVVLGLFGGLFVVYLRLRALATLGGGGRGARAVLVSCLALALLFAFGLAFLRQVPIAVVAGIVAMLAWTLVDRWTRQLALRWWRGDRSRELLLSLLVVAVVCLVTLGFGFAAGVLAGTALSMVIFVRALDRSLVRLRYSALEIPSLRIYPQALEPKLRAARARIEVIELEGALFFGSAHRLAAESDAALARNPALAHLVIDLRRVSTLDASGAVMLAQTADRLASRGVTLHLAGVTADDRHWRALAAQGVDPAGARWRLHPDADRAVEAAELALVESDGAALATLAVPLANSELLAGLDDAARAEVVARMPARTLAAGETLFAEGDPGDALYVLGEGSVSVVDRSGRQRFVSFSPGMCFGETAVLDGLGRSAAAVADRPSRVYRLSTEDLITLRAAHPEAAAQLYLNLARHLSQRLRSAAAAWRRAAE